jgi:hypothetical protein
VNIEEVKEKLSRGISIHLHPVVRTYNEFI